MEFAISDSFLLRHSKAEDAPELAKVLNDKELTFYMRMPYPYKLSDAEGWLEKILSEDHPTSFAIVETSSGRLIGGMGFHPDQIPAHQYTAEVGYWLIREFWGRGIVSQALRTLEDQAIRGWYNQQPGKRVHRLEAGVFSPNAASMRVLEKNGFVKEGVAKDAIFRHGAFYDLVKFAKILE